MAMAVATNTSGNNCFAILPTTNAKGYTSTINSSEYYSTATATFTIENTCSSPQTMSGLVVDVNGMTINGNAAQINYIEQAQGNPYLTMTYTTSGSNLAISLSTPACSGSCDWAEMPANSTRSFTINDFANSAISSFNISGVSISGSAPPPVSNGNLSLNVNTSALAPVCTSSTNCHIGVNVLDPTGAVIEKVSVNPYESPVYTVVYQNLLVGNYTLAVDTTTFPSGSSSSIGYTYTPSTGIAQVNSGVTTNSAVNFSYTAPKSVGNLTITTSNVPESAFSTIGSLSGVATDKTTKITYPFTVGLNGSYTISGLPSGDSVSVSLQGMGDAATGVYYTASTGQATIPTNSTSNVSISFNKVTTAQNSVAFSVTGAPANQNVSFADNNAVFKYNVDTLSNATYKFLTSESAVAVTLATPAGYSLTYTPSVITPSVKNFTATYTAQAPVASGGLTTKNDQIIDSNGNIVKLKGISWFGFNNGQIVNGLWNYDGIGGDFETTVLRLKALGFNAVRLPFSFSDILNQPYSNVVHNGVTPATTAQLITNLTDPNYSIAGKTFPSLTYSLPQTNSNDIIPQTTALADFIWMIDFFARNGFYVLVDNHTEDNSITQNSATWTQNWQNLAMSIVNGMPESSSNKVMYDIRNEPDAIGYNWTQMGPIYLSTMDAINTVTKGNNLFFIEGSGQSGLNVNWGDGFATNEALISQDGLSDPNTFFTSLMSKSYLNQVVLSPHVYGPSVTGATANYSGSGLYNRLSSSFGNLAKTGYCVGSTCHQFPIAIGEFGSEFTATGDLQFLQSFASYLNNDNDAVDGQHNAINNWFYWSYNPNSGDTGGIVDNSWDNVEWQKVEYLGYGTLSGMTNNNPNGVGLIPWYH
jgi:hypothetical protein